MGGFDLPGTPSQACLMILTPLWTSLRGKTSFRYGFEIDSAWFRIVLSNMWVSNCLHAAKRAHFLVNVVIDAVETRIFESFSCDVSSSLSLNMSFSTARTCRRQAKPKKNLEGFLWVFRVSFFRVVALGPPPKKNPIKTL